MNMLKQSGWLDRLMVYIEFVVSATLVLIGAFLAVVIVIDFAIFVLESVKMGVNPRRFLPSSNTRECSRSSITFSSCSS
jgi:hypothetical protein